MDLFRVLLFYSRNGGAYAPPQIIDALLCQQPQLLSQPQPQPQPLFRNPLLLPQQQNKRMRMMIHQQPPKPFELQFIIRNLPLLF